MRFKVMRICDVPVGVRYAPFLPGPFAQYKCDEMNTRPDATLDELGTTSTIDYRLATISYYDHCPCIVEDEHPAARRAVTA